MHKEFLDDREQVNELYKLIKKLKQSDKKCFLFALENIELETGRVTYKPTCFARDLDYELVENLNKVFEGVFLFLVNNYLDKLKNDTDRVVQ